MNANHGYLEAFVLTVPRRNVVQRHILTLIFSFSQTEMFELMHVGL